jgi:hypothetical protein
MCECAENPCSECLGVGDTHQILRAVDNPIADDGTPEDPFGSQRTDDNNPFAEKRDSVPELGSSPPSVPKHDHSASDQWGMTLPMRVDVIKGQHAER